MTGTPTGVCRFCGRKFALLFDGSLPPHQRTLQGGGLTGCVGVALDALGGAW